jgi:hypothetical protein
MRGIMWSLMAIVVLATGLMRGWAGGDDVQPIIDKAIKAHSPKGPNEKHKAYQGKNKGTIYVQGLELEFTQEIWVSPPAKFKEVMELTVMNVAVKTTTVYDGKQGWIKVNAGGNEMDIPVKDELLEEFKTIADMIGLGQLRTLKAKDTKLSLVGEAQVNGKPALGVRVSREGKKDLTIYFDKTTGLMAKVERRAVDFQTGQEATEERIIVSYKEVENQKIPSRVIVNRDGTKLLEADVIEARHLEAHPDSEFAKP